MLIQRLKHLWAQLQPGDKTAAGAPRPDAVEHSNVFRYKGYDIPLDLMMSTGGGPETFDAISRAHMGNLERFIGIRPDDQILEIGCGIGRDAIPLAERLSASGSYLGVDIIDSSISWCRTNITSKHPNFKFHLYDVQDKLYNPSGTTQTTDINLPVADNSVDLVILQSVFTHMFADDIVHYLKEFRRVLKDNGRVWATLFLYSDEILANARQTNLTPFNLRFEHQWAPGCRANDINMPTAAVAYAPQTFDQLIDSSGLRLTMPYLRGGWSGFFKDPPDGQDVAVLAKNP